MVPGVKTLSVDLRERIVAAYDAGDVTRAEVAQRFRVSEAMVKKLLQQRRRCGDIRPQHHRCGRKPRITPEHRKRLRELVAEKPDRTLAELRSCVGLNCTLPAIHYALAAMDLTYKKRLCMQQSRTGPISRGHGASGGANRAALTRPGSSSSTSQRRKQT
jgi:transposase